MINKKYQSLYINNLRFFNDKRIGPYYSGWTCPVGPTGLCGSTDPIDKRLHVNKKYNKIYFNSKNKKYHNKKFNGR